MLTTGFPSPAADYAEKRLSLDRYVIRHPEATYMMRCKEGGARNENIYPGDILVIDRSLTPADNDLILAVWSGTFKIIRYQRKKMMQYHEPVEAWGVITYILHELRTGEKK